MHPAPPHHLLGRANPQLSTLAGWCRCSSSLPGGASSARERAAGRRVRRPWWAIMLSWSGPAMFRSVSCEGADQRPWHGCRHPQASDHQVARGDRILGTHKPGEGRSSLGRTRLPTWGTSHYREVNYCPPCALFAWLPKGSTRRWNSRSPLGQRRVVPRWRLGVIALASWRTRRQDRWADQRLADERSGPG